MKLRIGSPFNALLLCAFLAEISASLDPILVRGNKMFNSKTGDRFFMKGITYGYAVDDDYYAKDGRSVFDTTMASLKGSYNTVRIYNVNPNKAYDLFMEHMDELGVYVLVGASPANDPYFGEYRYAAMRKDIGPTGSISTDSDGDISLDQTESCYPAKLLEYGKKVARSFAKFDNTLGLVIANEIMQTTLTAAACVKQYISDLKNWMRVNGAKMRLIPLSYAIADSAYGSGSPDSDTFGAIKLQGLLCGDVLRDGQMYQSVDIFLVNSYRWCPGSDFASAYARIVSWTSGAPVVIAMGEYGCKNLKSETREFEMIPYLFGDASGNQNMHEIFSGGTVYSYGEASQGSESAFPLFTGGSQDLTGKPSSIKTNDFDFLVSQYSQVDIPSEKADWDSSDKCRWIPPILTTVSASNSNVMKHGWITACSNVLVLPKDTWNTNSRSGAICSDNGSPCDVSVLSRVGTTQKDLCGFVDSISGGASCEVNADCGLHGVCSSGKCSCVGCYSGPSCNVLDSSICAQLSSFSGIAPIVASVAGVILAIMMTIFTTMYFRANSRLKETQKIGRRIKDQGTTNLASM